jgi:hypothetical protein
MESCAPEVKERLLRDFDDLNVRVRRVRLAILVFIGVIAIGVVYTKARRFSPEQNPMEIAGPQIPHPGIRPKPPVITPEPDTQRAIQKWKYQRRNYIQYPKPNKNGIQPLYEPVAPPLRGVPMTS